MTAFAHRLMRAEPTAGNWIVSPLSLACAFAMARVGARGETAAQLDAFFGFPAHGRDDAFNAITRQLVTADVPPRPTRATPKPGTPPAAPVVSLGNGLFLQRGFQVGEAFLRTLAAAYGAGFRSVDFSTPEALRQLDAWVSAQTAGRITKLFDSLDASTELVLANAVYFKGDWVTTFDAHITMDAPFTRIDGTTTSAPMMNQAGRFRYASVNGAQIVEVPYARGPYAMWIMLPRPNGSMNDLLTPQTMSAIGAALAPAQVDMYVPRWDFATTIDLGTVLPAIGLTVPFSGGADFGGIASGLAISQAIHQANITVGEWGTVAAAVTAIAGVTSGRISPPDRVTFRADRPFVFAIVGGDNHVPLFVGRVTDPSAK
jgi:serpin B